MMRTTSLGERFKCQPGENFEGSLMGRILDMNNVASWYFQKGDYGNASTLLDEACSVDKDFFRELSVWEAQDQAQNSSPLHDLASTQIELTQPQSLSNRSPTDYFDEGFRCYQGTEAILVTDMYQIAMATLWYNAGQAKQQLQNAPAAMRCFKRAISILQFDAFFETNAARILIPTLINIGKLWYRESQLDLSHFMSRNCKEPRTGSSGGDSLSLGLALNCLGVLYFHKSFPRDEMLITSSLDCVCRSHEILSSVLGAGHTAVATVLNNMGRVLVQRDKHQDALQCYRKALDIRRQQLGSDCLDYGATAYNIGQCLYKLGELDQAMEMYQHFLGIAKKRITGGNRRDISVVLGGMAQICEDKKDLNRALQLYEEALKIGRETMGEVHAEIASLWNRIGNLHYRRRDMDMALKCYQAGLAIDTQILSDDTHPNVAITLSNIGEVYRQTHNYDEAIRVYNDVLVYQQRKHGCNEPNEDIASTLSSLGLIYDQKGELKTAQRFLERALDVKLSLFGEDNLGVSTALMHVGCILYKRNRTARALKVFTRAANVRKKLLGGDHRDVAFSHYNLGLCHMVQSHYNDAIACFCETVRIERLVLGNVHQDVAMTLYKLGQAYYAEGDMDHAITNLQEAVRIGEELEEEVFEPVTVARALNQIGSIHLMRGETTSMMEALNEAARILRREGFNPHNVLVMTQLQFSLLDDSEACSVRAAPAA